MTMTKAERRAKRNAQKQARAMNRLRFVAMGGAYASDAGKRGYRVLNFETMHSCVVAADVLKAGMDQGLDIKVTL